MKQGEPMGGRIRRLGAVSVLVLVGSLLSGQSAGAAPISFVVQAGAVHPERGTGAGYEFTRYYPEQLQIHRGQAVRWVMPGVSFHSITFVPEGDPRPAFIRAEEAPGAMAFGQRWIGVSQCGHGGQEQCVLSDRDTFLSSGPGPQQAPFDVVFDAEPGVYNYLCVVHATMTGQIEIVDDTTPLQPREQINAQTEADVAADAAEADAYVESISEPTSSIVDGRRVWDVLVGPSTPSDHVTLLGFVPATLQIEVGDGVRWAIPDGVENEVHTVAFPSQGTADDAIEIASFSIGACDLDDPETGAPGILGVWSPTTCPGEMETWLAPWFADEVRAPGNQVVGRTVHQSGFMLPEDAPEGFRGAPPGSGEYFPHTFDAVFPAPVSNPYVCYVHNYAGMTGAVVVV